MTDYCRNCRKELESGKGYFSPNGYFCLDCIVVELKKDRDTWIKNHPCPFRGHGIYGIPAHKETDMKLYCGIHTVDSGLSKDGKNIEGYVRVNVLCFGEKNCPVYNGGMK